MFVQSTVIRYGDHVDTDVIIPARYLNTTDPAELAAHCMEDLDSDFKRKSETSRIIVAGRNFGCGSSREHAPIAIKASGIQLVIADSFARIFYSTRLISACRSSSVRQRPRPSATATRWPSIWIPA